MQPKIGVLRHQELTYVNLVEGILTDIQRYRWSGRQGSRVVTSSEYRSEMCGRELLMFAKLLSRALPPWDFRDAKPRRKRFVARLEQATTVFFQTATPSIARGEEGGFIPFPPSLLKV